MAPPPSRRSGHSRRAQYSLFTGYVIAGLGALAGAALLLVSIFQPNAFSSLRGLAGDSAQPPASAAASARSSGKKFFAAARGYFRAGEQNARLRKEVEIARIRLAEAKALKQENLRLRALLGLKEAEVKPVVVTRLIGSSATSARRYAYLGAGRKQGVGVGMAVRSPRGVVGRVLEVGNISARVLLLTDSESVLPVRRASDNVVAFAQGRGTGLLRIRLINLGLNPLKKGDVFVTSGAGGYYRPGIAVAVVEEITDDGGLARLIADPAGADFVSVEPLWQSEALAAAASPPDQEPNAPASTP